MLPSLTINAVLFSLFSDSDFLLEVPLSKTGNLIGLLLQQRSSAAAAAAQATQTSIRSASRTGNITKKMVAPTLSNPDSLTIAEFRYWKVRLRDFMDLNDGGNELRHPASLHAFLRLVLATGWTRLWTAGRLGISSGDDFDTFLEKMDQYIRKKRSPLIDRRNFQHRDQLEGETVDSYFAALFEIAWGLRLWRQTHLLIMLSGLWSSRSNNQHTSSGQVHFGLAWHRHAARSAERTLWSKSIAWTGFANLLGIRI